MSEKKAPTNNVQKIIANIKAGLLDNISIVIVGIIVALVSSFGTFIITTATAINPLDTRLSTLEVHADSQKNLDNDILSIKQDIKDIKTDVNSLKIGLDDSKDERQRIEGKLDQLLLILQK